MKKLSKIPTLQMVHKTVACLLAFCVINMPVWAIQNGDVINPGGAAINITDNVLTNVNVGAGNTTIDWGNLNTIKDEQLNFNGSGNFAVLNNVISNSATNFNGILNGNGGHIIIVNQHGVVFGPDAFVSAAHFTASTLAIDDFDGFVNGDGSWFNTADAKGVIELQNGATIDAANIELIAQEIRNSGQLISDGGLVILATGDEVYLGSSVDDIVVMVDMPVQGDPSYSISNNADGLIDNTNGAIVLAAGDDFAQAVKSDIQNAAYRIPGQYSVSQSGQAKSARLDLSAANAVLTNSGSNSQVSGDINIGAMSVEIGETLNAGNNLTIGSDHGVMALSDISSNDQMSITSHSDENSIALGGSATSGGSMEMSSGVSILMSENVESGDTATFTAADNVISFADIKAQSDISVNGDLVLFNEGDQSVASENGSIIAEGTITKISEGYGNLYIAAEDDVQLNGDVTNNMGGVSVISESGAIDTEGTGVLNVAISGYSDSETGVDLPYGEGKAAIVLMSQDSLVLGPDADLTASGSYGPGVDDRAGVDLLDVEQKVIGGFPRQAGEEIDVAIYAASTGGDVVYGDSELLVLNQQETPDATIVLDAFDSVRFAPLETMTPEEYALLVEYVQLLIDEGIDLEIQGTFRLEVVSRITQWLDEAISNGTLPLAEAPEVMEYLLGGSEYVLRGAGVPANRYNEAWVLEDEQPLPEIATAPLQNLEIPELKGCPAEMDAAASELSVNSDQMQLMIASSIASNPNIQPCEACSSLLTAAATLRDVDGARMAALAQIFDTLAPADAPFTPEVSASIATAFAELSADNPQYAMASEYVDAFANYVAIVDNDLKLPVGDSVALVMEKYGAGLTNSDNPNIAAFISAQMEATGGSL